MVENGRVSQNLDESEAPPPKAQAGLTLWMYGLAPRGFGMLRIDCASSVPE